MKTQFLMKLALAWSCLAAVHAQDLAWLTDKDQVMEAAMLEGKLVLLLAGTSNCFLTRYMQDEVCATLDPPIRDLIRDKYVPWFCDLDSSADADLYAADLGLFTLPLICCIDPAQPEQYLDRTTGTQSEPDFYARLRGHTTD